MSCPNCGREVREAGDFDGHAPHCLLAALVGVLLDRGHDLTGIDLGDIDADALWHAYGGPAADFLAEQLGLDHYLRTQEETCG
jgi:hypothetical protein